MSPDEAKAHVAYRRECCRRTWMVGRMRGSLLLRVWKRLKR